MKPRLIIPWLVLAAALLLAPATSAPRPAAASPQAGQPDVQALREQLRRLARERDDAASRDAFIPLEEEAVTPEVGVKGAWAALRLVNEMEGLTALWTFEPAEAGAAPAIRVPLALKGEQSLVLAPGQWRATLLVGRPGSGEWLRRPAQTLTLRDHAAYRLALTASVQHALSLELSNRGREAQATPTAAPLEPRPRGGTPARSPNDSR